MECWLCKGTTNEAHWTKMRLLCKECFGKRRHRYYYLNRPPGISCQPDGFIDRERWAPAVTLNLGRRAVTRAHGFVEYPEPLEPAKVWKWELWPADDGEFDQYQNWCNENRR